jgi:general transcription factor 3C polypeptide 5 (transcription factor C subunit 1)
LDVSTAAPEPEGERALCSLVFPGMSDFQYLAVHTEAGGKHVSMYDRVLMRKPEKEEFFHQELPLYIPPPIFSRLDTPVDYFYRPETQHR